MALATTAVFAQTNSIPAPIPDGISTGKSYYWQTAIAGITPIIVTLIRWLVPKIPSMLLPTMTPVLGIGFGILFNYLSKANLSWMDMAQAGALAVFVRETFNQVVTKRMQPPAA